MRWNKTCKEFAKIRDYIDEEKSDEIIKGLLNICEKYANEDWDYAEDFERLKDDIDEDVDETIEDVDSETVDYWLSEFYDLCDAAKVWLEV